MEKINKQNYEAWFLDYSEGSLSERQIVELNIFISLNPELRVELDGFESVSLEEEAISSANLMDYLIREEITGLTRSDYLMIAAVEGAISKEEKAELGALVSSNTGLVEDLAMYHKTKLPKDEMGVFTGKSGLIQKERKVIAWWMYASTAAALLAFFLWNSNISNEQYAPRGFAWEAREENLGEILSRNFVAAEKMELRERVTKVSFSSKTNQFAQQNEKVPSKKRQNREVLLVANRLEQQHFEVKSKSVTPPKENPRIEAPIELKSNEMVDALVAVTPDQAEQKFVPIQKFAKDKIKKEVLKGKTFSETVAEEIANLSNDKITFEIEEEKGGLFDSFALNIGKLSISRNR